MSITDELRKYADDLDKKAAMKSEHGFSPIGMRLSAIADRIDEEHEKALSEQFESLTVGMKPMTEENMAEGGWVRLPVDGDGKPIHVGDVIAHVPDGIKELAPETVVRIVLSKDEQRIVTEDCSYSVPKFLRHVEPTVESVLRELCAAYMDTPLDDSNQGEFFAEYAAKLRLADDREEQ